MQDENFRTEHISFDNSNTVKSWSILNFRLPIIILGRNLLIQSWKNFFESAFQQIAIKNIAWLEQLSPRLRNCTHVLRMCEWISLSWREEKKRPETCTKTILA